jgi:hypothetical protein
MGGSPELMNTFFEKFGTTKCLIGSGLPLMKSIPMEHVMEHICLETFRTSWVVVPN